MIVGISMQLPERWKLKIGGKGEERQGKSGAYRLPVKWPFMQICRNERDENGNFAIDAEITEVMGAEPYEWKSKDGKTLYGTGPRLIGPIALLYNDPDLNFFTAYRCRLGKVSVCKGDGVKAMRLDVVKGPGGYMVNPDTPPKEVSCPCKNLTGREKTCKPNGIFSFLLPDAPLEGVCKFRTTAYSSIRAIMGGMELVRSLTRGRLVGVPFYLRLNETQAQVQGKVQTIYFVSLESHDTMKGMWEKVLEYTKDEAAHLIELEQAEMKARRQIALTADIVEDPDGDPDVDEFYPEYEEAGDGSIVDKQTGELVEAKPEEKKTPTFPMKQKKAPDPERESEPEPEPEEEEAEPVTIDIGEGGLI